MASMVLSIIAVPSAFGDDAYEKVKPRRVDNRMSTLFYVTLGSDASRGRDSLPYLGMITGIAPQRCSRADVHDEVSEFPFIVSTMIITYNTGKKESELGQYILAHHSPLGRAFFTPAALVEKNSKSF
ncbi:hypothetical protein EVAR_35333_1 [Eumeta japonica]|uniref:Uncharacterized protein n=1 Tax=Eumeta variegata TaxID=151549 RepID=A0A4C1XJV2_EUMVA|nr:hypothetical protein EVAR_35333_1 [Eumeta japonica]